MSAADDRSVGATLRAAMATVPARRPSRARRWALARERQLLVVRSLVDANRGDWVGQDGDETLALFEDSGRAVRCARALLHTLEGDRELALRIGIDFGPVERREHQAFGAVVDGAREVRSVAPERGIALSESALERARERETIEATRKEASDPGQVVWTLGGAEPGRKLPSWLDRLLKLDVILVALALAALALFAWVQLASRLTR